MQDYCHRCGEELPPAHGESTFCPHCGAPQLTLSLENQTIPAAEAEGTPTTGTVPPPRPSLVDWKAAVSCAAIVAAIGVVLTLVSLRLVALQSVCFLWVMSGSLIAMGLYHRLRPTAWIDARVGARIGMVVGLSLAVALIGGMAGWGVFARFVLHSMGSFDAQLTAVLAQGLAAQQQKQSTPMPSWFVGFVTSPEFRAGSVLFTCAFMTGGVLVISTIAGAFAGFLRIRRGQMV